MITGNLKVRIQDGRIDKEALETKLKSLIPRYETYDFDYESNRVWVKAWKKGMQEDHVDLFLFMLYERQ